MNNLQTAIVQNTINELENEISKHIVYSNSTLLMNRAVNHIKLLMLHISYIEAKLKNYEDNSIFEDPYERRSIN